MPIDKNKLSNKANDSFASLMGNSTKKIHVTEIRENPLNLFSKSDERVNALAVSLSENKQFHNITVYEDDLDDGKKYTLISGETRCRAIDRLYSFNTSLKIYHDGYIDAIIVSKPKDELEERKMIVEANNQRDMTDDDFYFIIKTYEEEYNELKKAGNKPPYDRRDYVGNKMGKTGRWVTQIKNKIEGTSDKTKRTANSGRTAYNKAFAKKIADKYKFTTSVSAKSITFKCCDTEELNDLLAHFGIDMTYEYKE